MSDETIAFLDRHLIPRGRIDVDRSLKFNELLNYYLKVGRQAHCVIDRLD